LLEIAFALCAAVSGNRVVRLSFSIGNASLNFFDKFMF